MQTRKVHSLPWLLAIHFIMKGDVGLGQEAQPEGVDVVLDTVGGAQFQEALKAVKWGAQILFIGFASGDIPKV